MDFRKRNLDKLKKEANYLYQSMEENDDFKRWSNSKKLFQCDNIYSDYSKDKHLITYINSNDYMFRMNSSYYPTREASIWSKQYSTKTVGRTNRTLYLFGLGNGYYVQELSKVIEDNETIIIYEPSREMLFYVLDRFDLTDILGRPKVFIFVEGINSEKLKDCINQSGATMMYDDSTLIKLPYYDQIYSKQYEWFSDMYEQRWISAMIDGNTAKAFGKDWVSAVLDNLVIALQSGTIESYKGILPATMPVIVVAAGPSLELNVDILKRAKGKALILAVDTSLNFLYERGIEPDFAVTLDVHKPLFLFENPLGKKVPMLISISGNPSVIEYSDGPKVFYDYTDFLTKVKYGEVISDSVNPAGSVATSAFDIARYMGANTIILVGQDLAYKGEKTHATGLELYKEHSVFTSVEGNYGGQLNTRHDWYTFLLWYENMISHYDGIVVNATEGGAKIKGTLIMTLSDAIDKYCVNDFDTKELFEGVTCKKLNLNEIENNLASLVYQLNDIINISEEAISLCEYLINDSNQASEESYVAKNKTKRLAQINAQINSYTINDLITQYIYDVFIDEYQTIFNRFDEKHKNRMNVYIRAKKVYEAVNSASVELRINIKGQMEKLYQEGNNYNVK